MGFVRVYRVWREFFIAFTGAEYIRHLKEERRAMQTEAETLREQIETINQAVMYATPPGLVQSFYPFKKDCRIFSSNVKIYV